MNWDHKRVSGKSGKWVYITSSEFYLVQVKFIRVQTLKYKNDPQRYFQRIKTFPPKNFSRTNFFFKLFFLPHNFHLDKLCTPKNWVKFFAKFGKFWNLITLAFFVRSWWSFCCWNQHLLGSTVQLITPFHLVVSFHVRGHKWHVRANEFRMH